jgi:hypothetical protein
MSYVLYTSEVEQPLDGEAGLMADLESMMVDLARLVHDKHGHSYHGTHAKLTGLLTGTFEVLPNLAPELAQGLFAAPASYDAIVRLSTGAPEPLTDKASGQRGLSIKVLGVDGERVADMDEQRTQDWVLGLDPAFTAATARDFQRVFKRTGAQSPRLPETAILALSRAARGAEAVIEAAGGEAPNLKFFGRPPAHPFAEPFFSQAAVRYGTFIAKLGAFPSRSTLDALATAPPLEEGKDAFRKAASRFAADLPITYDIKAQLCTDLSTMPVEDSSVVWPESASPYRTVARLILPPQLAWTPERAAFDDRLAFNPGHALCAHQPLGSIMRARIRAYKAVQRYRQATNGVHPAEPATCDEIA